MAALQLVTNNERPQWEYIFDLMDGRDPGTLITYDAMAEVFPESFDRDRHRSAIRQAGRKLLELRSRAIAPVRGVGYRIIPADAQLAAAHHKRLSAKRMTGRAKLLVERVRRDEVSSPELLAKFDDLAQRMNDLERRLTRNETKTQNMAIVLQEVVRKQYDDDTSVGHRLAALEQALQSRGLLQLPQPTDPDN
jgi:hypothetical protein